jgi:hypothetical protein
MIPPVDVFGCVQEDPATSQQEKSPAPISAPGGIERRARFDYDDLLELFSS